MDNLEESSMLIHLSDGNVIKFQECDYVLYYYNMAQGADSNNRKNKSKSLVTNYYPNPLSQFVATVK